MRLHHRIRQQFSPRLLTVALLFGLSAAATILAGLALKIPGTSNTTDAREIFVTVGSSLTGPVGAFIIGFCAGVVETDDSLRLYVISQHVVGGLWMALLYWQLYKRLRRPATFLPGWALLVLSYYFLSGVPGLILVKVFWPGLLTGFVGHGGTFFEQMYAIDRSWLLEAWFTIVITTTAMVALPDAYRMPLWRTALDYRHTIASRHDTSRAGRGVGVLAVRLTVWFLVLSVLPITVVVIFIRDNVNSSALESAKNRDLNVVRSLASMLAQNPTLRVLPFSVGDQMVVVLDHHGTVVQHPDSTRVGRSAEEVIGVPIMKNILQDVEGAFADSTGGVVISCSSIPGDAGTVIMLHRVQENRSEMRRVERITLVRLVSSLVIISITGGMVIWFFVGWPMRRMVKATSQVTAGNLNAVVRTGDLEDDIGELARRFNTMTASLRGARNGLIAEIDERKEKDRALKLSEEKFAKAFHTSPDGIAINRVVDGVYVEINEGFGRLTGFMPEDLIGYSSMEKRIWVDTKDRSRLVEALKVRGFVTDLEAEFRRKDGSTLTGLMSARTIIINDVRCIISITRDITGRKRDLEALQESESRFRSVFENAAVGICSASLDGRMLTVNRSFSEITGYSRDELLCLRFQDITAEDAEGYAKDIERLLAGSAVSVTSEKRYRNKKKAVLWVNETVSLVKDAGGAPRYFIGFIEDVTEKKQSAQAIESSLREKELLLKEVHHRVKNNLQVISSLLNLQLNSIRDPFDKVLFRESQDRIRSMALIHEKLYQSEDFGSISFSSYLGSLVSTLFHTYSLTNVEHVVNAEDIRLPLDTAIPCGLITNELVANSLKHAFPADRRGTITVTFRRREDRRLELEVRDDGVGLPKGFDKSKSETLGLQLVRILSDQLKASFELTSDNGTTAEIILDDE